MRTNLVSINPDRVATGPDPVTIDPEPVATNPDRVAMKADPVLTRDEFIPILRHRFPVFPDRVAVRLRTIFDES